MSLDENIGPERASPKDEAAILNEQVRALYGTPSVLLVNLVTALAAAAVLWELYPAWILMAWLAAMAVVVGGRVALRGKYRRSRPDARTAGWWARRFALGTALTGCLWGLLGTVVLVTGQSDYYAFAAFALAGMTAAAAIYDSAYLPAFYGFLVPALAPITILLLFSQGLRSAVMALMSSVFAAVLAVMARSIYRRTKDNIELTFALQEVNADLRVSISDLNRAEQKATEGEEMFRSLAENDVSGISIIDEDGRVVYVNPRLLKLLGFNPGTELAGRSVLDFLVVADKPTAGEAMRNLFAGRVRTTELVVTLATTKGEVGGILVQGSLATFRGKRTIIAVALDINERMRADDERLLANTVLSTIMETSRDAILVVDAQTRIIRLNQRFGQMWHVPPEVMAAGDDGPVLAAVAAGMKDPQAFLERVRQLYADPSQIGDDELVLADGRYVHRYSAALRSQSQQYLGRVWFFSDVTERRLAEADVLHAARHDVLTGLANRRVFVEALEDAMARANRDGKSFAVLYLDLDHFKDINDTLGHPIGDRLLCAVADRLRHTARKTDVAARFGGDEFALIAADITEPADAAELAEKLVQAVCTPFSIGGDTIRTGASIGVAVYEPGVDTAEALLSHADVALYRAKAEGRGLYRFFTDAMDEEVRTRVTLASELRDAIGAGQLFLEYQPQIDLETGRVAGVEALVRWRHPKRGVLSPAAFISVAEKSGLIVSLDRWVLREACRQGRAWLDAGAPPIAISVNVSGAHFKSSVDLETDIALVLRQSGFPIRSLILEITETILMQVAQKNNDILVRLRQSGISLSIDDFGTGYSSFAYLLHFPVNQLKIAREFVSGIIGDATSAAIVRAIIAMAGALGTSVLAEGAETAEQVALLRTWGCGQVQGHHFAAAMAPEAITALLARGGFGAPTRTAA